MGEIKIPKFTTGDLQQVFPLIKNYRKVCIKMEFILSDKLDITLLNTEKNGSKKNKQKVIKIITKMLTMMESKTKQYA